MGQVVNTNISSLTAQRNLNSASSSLSSSFERLSSGLRINSAADDAAGVAISTRFDAQTRGISVATRNASDGISLAQTAEGALSNVVDNLQRLRELSLQSSNGTNSAIDRESLNAEAQQIISEIGRITETTNFNGVNLLDGSFEGTQFQIGANNGETFSFDINDVGVDALGGGETVGVSTRGTANALVQGDLVINGTVIGASTTNDDTASSTAADTSAIAKAAAINRSTGDTGVIATVLTNTSGGAAQTGASLTGTITVNGVTVNVSTTTDTDSTRAAVVTAINSVSDRTGVVAVDTGNTDEGVVLEAADGRNIQVALGTVTSAATGVTAGTSQGGLTLTSVDGNSPISIQEGTTGNLATNAGLEAGTFQAGTASISSSDSNGTALAAGDVVINGTIIGASLASDDTASSASNAGSAIAKAAAINRATAETGVTATVNANTVDGAAQAGASLTGTITINGVTTASISTTTDTADSRALTVQAINDISGQTGVRAIDTGSDADGVQLVADDGRNIVVALATVTSAATGVTAGSAQASFTLSSAGAIEVSAGTGTLANSGLDVGTSGGSEDGQFLSEVDISTVAGAQSAITAIDNALETINSERAGLGAVQNRLTSTVANLEVTSENLSAANSRIKDLDFARETAELSRNQVLQQAGVSILSQANASSQVVLSLLG